MIGIIMQIFYQLLVMLAMTGILNGGVPQKDPDAYTPSAVIDYVETGMEQKGNELIFGNLFIVGSAEELAESDAGYKYVCDLDKRGN